MDKKIVYSDIPKYNQKTQYLTQMEPIDMGDYIYIGLAIKAIDDSEAYESMTPLDIKMIDIVKCSEECQQRIYDGFDSDCLGETKHFDCEDHDQMSIAGLAITAILGVQGLTDEECHWKATGELECYKFEYAQILQLAVDMKKHVQTQIDQFNAERLAILNAD